MFGEKIVRSDADELFVSIRFRWRVFGELNGCDSLIVHTCFNPLSLESVWRVFDIASMEDPDSSFNPLSLESVWRDQAQRQHQVLAGCFNPLSLESVWRVIRPFETVFC